jgi:membrane carboxypeptidase/penicillin-binding protein PbpC
MAKRGMEMPPSACSPELRKTEEAHASAPMIVFPREGDIFRIDPILRREYQIIHLKAMVPEHIKKIYWWIDGKRVGASQYPFIYKWALKIGLHCAQVGVDSRGLSKKVNFYVH